MHFYRSKDVRIIGDITPKIPVVLVVSIKATRPVRAIGIAPLITKNPDDSAVMVMAFLDGLSIPKDQLIFVGCLFLTYPLSFIYLWIFPRGVHRTHGEQKIQHIVVGCFGILVCYMTYGAYSIFHISLMMAYSYWIMLIAFQFGQLKSKFAPISVFVISMLHLSYCHLYRQFFNPRNSIDLSGPMMIITIKATSFAWNVWNGYRFYANESKAEIPVDKNWILPDNFPSFIEYFGFTFFFPSILAGPAIEYVDYQDGFSDDEIYARSLNDIKDETNKLKARKKHIIGPATTLYPSLQRLAYGLFFMLYHVALSGIFPSDYYRSDEFLSITFNPVVLLYRCIYIYLCLQGFKSKFYFVWIISEGACIAMSYGIKRADPNTSKAPRFMLTKLDKDLVVEWNGLSNVEVSKIETGTSFTELTRLWNKKTHLWLKKYVFKVVLGFYEGEMKENNFKRKLPSIAFTWATIAVYAVSAAWHGFYPGYYLTFLSGAFVNIAEKAFEKHFGPLFHTKIQNNQIAALGIKFLGIAWSQYILAYVTLPFVNLDFLPSIASWKSLLFNGHAIIISLMISDKFISSEQKKQKRN